MCHLSAPDSLARSRSSRPIRLIGVATVLVLLSAFFTALVAGPPSAAPAAAATQVPKSACRAIDPNLVNGVCLRYRTRSGGTALTWIGTYRAADGRVFFCIDYLYDSRLPGSARRVSTENLRNQFGDGIGDAEVAALNRLVSKHAPDGSTGSDAKDAAIALIVRQVMSDGIRRDGLVVYPRGLEVGDRVRHPAGGLPGRVVPLARKLWRDASLHRGPYRLELRGRSGSLRLGQKRTYRVRVISAAGVSVRGMRVRISCRGPIRCPRSVRSLKRAKRIVVEPRSRGRFRISASVRGPAADGVLYVTRSWRAHGGDRARRNGVQRGWIAQRNTARAAVSDRAVIVKARPRVVTETSAAEVLPGAAIHDVVTVSGSSGKGRLRVVSRLYGPYEQQPGATDCAATELVDESTFTVPGDGTFHSPSVMVPSVGYYTWTQEILGDLRTRGVVTECGLVPETTFVDKLTPRVQTVASKQRAMVGNRIFDTVEVTGIGRNPVRIGWWLQGPKAPSGGSCNGLDWSGVPIVDSGHINATGSGRYRTPRTRVRASGCYTYSENIGETAVVWPVTAPAGIPAETFLVRSQPHVTTVASTQRAEVGARVFDHVDVNGLSPGDKVWVTWRLHGPVPPVNGGCGGVDWTGSPIADTGVFAADRNGRFRSGTTTIDRPGCYTYSEAVPGTVTTMPTSTRPGIPVETFVVSRQALPKPPIVPSGGASRPQSATADDPRYLFTRYEAPPASSVQARGSVNRLRIPRLGIAAPVDAVRMDGRVMAIPNAPSRLGWLRDTPLPAEQQGASVISGHVSDRRDRPGALWRLKSARKGDVITWQIAGRTHEYRVVAKQSYPRGRDLPTETFKTTGAPLLRIITCSVRRSTGGGGFTYTRNLVVTAKPVRVSVGG